MKSNIPQAQFLDSIHESIEFSLRNLTLYAREGLECTTLGKHIISYMLLTPYVVHIFGAESMLSIERVQIDF